MEWGIKFFRWELNTPLVLAWLELEPGSFSLLPLCILAVWMRTNNSQELNAGTMIMSYTE
jgi:hypothetical protein